MVTLKLRKGVRLTQHPTDMKELLEGAFDFEMKSPGHLPSSVIQRCFRRASQTRKAGHALPSPCPQETALIRKSRNLLPLSNVRALQLILSEALSDQALY